MRFIIGIQRNANQLSHDVERMIQWDEPSTIVYDVAFWEDQSRSAPVIISHAAINILEQLDLISGFGYGCRSVFPFDWDQFLQDGGDLGNHHGFAGHHPFLPDQSVPSIQWSSNDDESSLVATSWDPKRHQIDSSKDVGFSAGICFGWINGTTIRPSYVSCIIVGSEWLSRL